MNLKEAFRFSNKLQKRMEEANNILGKERNVIRVENTALQSRVNPGSEDVVTVEVPDTEYAEQMNGETTAATQDATARLLICSAWG